MRKLRLLIIIFIATIVVAKAQSDNWLVPDDKAAMTAPAIFTDEMKEAGDEIYKLNCKSCHGDVGQHNMAPLNPLPADLATLGNESDGAIYFKINEGKGAMPTFKTRLSTSDKWNVIAYVRSFDKDYVQSEPQKAIVFGGSAVVLKLDYLAEKKQFKVFASGKKDEAKEPAEGVEVALYAKRYFGNLKIADNKSTNKDGIVFFNVPSDLPADKEGMIEVLVKVTDPDKYGDAIAKANVSAGIAVNMPGLNEKRAMWNTVKKAPLWITIVYPLAVLSVLATLLYIALLLKKVYLLGKNQDKNENK